MQQSVNKEAESYRTRQNLLNKIWEKVSSVKQVDPLIASITRMTQHALNASASSLLLLDEENHELLFMFADGPAGKQLRRLRISQQSGIAGWVVQNGKPLIVNDVSKDQRFNKSIDLATGFVTRSIICAPLLIQRKVTGAIEVLNRLDGSNFSERDLQTLIGVATTAALAIENDRLYQSLLDSYKSTINALVSASDIRETYASGHSRRVSQYALIAANALSLSKEEKQIIEYAAILHDIGKIGIPDRILTKSGALTPEEWAVVHKHPTIGANVLKGIPFLEKARGFILHHHERYDGKGYPGGLKGEEIPMGARLIAVADAFDTMTTNRSYRAALGTKNAFIDLRRCAGSQFCPVAVKAFCSGFIQSNLSSKF